HDPRAPDRRPHGDGLPGSGAVRARLALVSPRRDGYREALVGVRRRSPAGAWLLQLHRCLVHDAGVLPADAGGAVAGSCTRPPYARGRRRILRPDPAVRHLAVEPRRRAWNDARAVRLRRLPSPVAAEREGSAALLRDPGTAVSLLEVL